MTRIFWLLIIGAMLGLAACGEKTETAEAPQPTPNVSEAPTPAIEPAPKTDDVPRDENNRPLAYKLMGQKLPALSLTTLSGDPIILDSFENWTIIDFWGIWCGDCRADARFKTALAAAVNQDPSLDFMTIHTPPNKNRVDEAFGSFGSVDAYFTQTGNSFPTLIDPDATGRDTAKIRWTPTYLIVDPEGIVRHFQTDLSVREGEPVKDLVRRVAELKKEASN